MRAAVHLLLAASGSTLPRTTTPALIASSTVAIKRCKDYDTAFKLISELRSSGQADVFAFATAISVYGKYGRWKEAIALLDIMQSDGITPDRPCFNSALAVCARCGRTVEATELLNRMTWASLPPFPASYAAAGRAALQAGDATGALAALEQLRCSGLRPELASLKVELTAHETLLASSGSASLDGDGSSDAPGSSRHIAQLTHQTLHVHSESSGGLSGSDMAWLWRTYSRAQLHAIRSRLRRDETLSADADATSSLLTALARSTTTGLMPCFQDEHALAGYVDRAQPRTLPDALPDDAIA